MNYLILLASNTHGGGGASRTGTTVSDVFSIYAKIWNFLRVDNITFGTISFSLFDVALWGLLVSCLFYIAYKVNEKRA